MTEQPNPNAEQPEAEFAQGTVTEAGVSQVPVTENGGGVTEAGVAAPQGADERIAALERELDQERERATDYMKNWQRAQADFSNFKRRTQQEREELAKFGESMLLAEIFPALDNFDRAWQTLPAQFRGFSWISGMQLIEIQLRGLVDRRGVTRIEAQGHMFDPKLHEAVHYEETDSVPEGTIVQVFQTGYRLDERVLRPALVSVARATPKEAEVVEGAFTEINNDTTSNTASEAPEGAPADAATPGTEE